MSSNICLQRYLLQNRPQATHKSPRKSLLHSPANTPLGLLEPLKDSCSSRNAKIRPLEFPQWNSQHCGTCCAGAQNIYGTFIKNVM